MAVRLLVVEDEPDLREVVCRALTESGFEVSTAVTGREGANSLCSNTFALGIVDLVLPGMNGWDIIRHVREQGVTTPILVLSARNGLQDKVRALDLGADDYLPKPFRTEELLARVRALLRRSTGTPQFLLCSDLSMETASRTVHRAGRQLVLSPKEYGMLEILLKNVGQPVSKAALLAQVWNDKSHLTDNIVEVYAGYLRQKIEEGGLPRLIHTVRNTGYMASESGPN